MIGGVTKFAGGSRDARALAAHLGKPQPNGSAFEAVNSAAADVTALIGEARAMASAAGIANRPFLHIHLSPSGTLDRAQLLRAAEVVCRELGVEDQPWGVELHGKPRASGEGGLHAHIVLGRAGASGKVLPSGFEKIRLETAVRVAEFEVGDAHVLGRHFNSSVKHLEATGRQDVVASMRTAHAGPPPPPRGLSSEKRQALARGGVDAMVQRKAVQAAWSKSDDGKSFAAALAEAGLELRRGDKEGVWLVAIGRINLGSVDRLVGEKRRDVAARLGTFQPSAVDGGTNPGNDQASGPGGGSGPKDPGGDRGVDRGSGRFAGGTESGPRPARDRGDPARQPVQAPRPHGGFLGTDRDAPDHESFTPAQRRSAVAALTVAVAALAADRLAQLRDLAFSIARRDRDALEASDRRLAERARGSVSSQARETITDRVSRILAAQRADTCVDHDDARHSSALECGPPRP